jgi:hypothetical protein
MSLRSGPRFLCRLAQRGRKANGWLQRAEVLLLLSHESGVIPAVPESQVMRKSICNSQIDKWGPHSWAHFPQGCFLWLSLLLVLLRQSLISKIWQPSYFQLQEFLILSEVKITLDTYLSWAGIYIYTHTYIQHQWHVAAEAGSKTSNSPFLSLPSYSYIF